MAWNTQDMNLGWYIPKANVDQNISGQETAFYTLDHSGTTPRTNCMNGLKIKGTINGCWSVKAQEMFFCWGGRGGGEKRWFISKVNFKFSKPTTNKRPFLQPCLGIMSWFCWAFTKKKKFHIVFLLCWMCIHLGVNMMNLTLSHVQFLPYLVIFVAIREQAHTVPRNSSMVKESARGILKWYYVLCGW